MFDKAKLYNNVIKPAFLNIPIDIVKHTNTKVTDLLNLIQVRLPGLHMSLGIYDRLWSLLEGACTELDLLLAQWECWEIPMRSMWQL